MYQSNRGSRQRDGGTQFLDGGFDVFSIVTDVIGNFQKEIEQIGMERHLIIPRILQLETHPTDLIPDPCVLRQRDEAHRYSMNLFMGI